MKVITYTFIILLIGIVGFVLFPQPEAKINTKVDYIVINKSKRELLIYSAGNFIKKYKISLGRNPVSKKEYEDDKRTPEGKYFIDSKNENSSFHKNLGISYPNAIDSLNAIRLNKNTGGNIKIHGLKNGLGLLGKLHRLFDWTAGCIAVTNDEIDELYSTVRIGTIVEINP